MYLDSEGLPGLLPEHEHGAWEAAVAEDAAGDRVLPEVLGVLGDQAQRAAPAARH